MTLTLLEQEMLEALKWYEARVCDCRKNTSDGDRARYELDRDGGKRASAVIKKVRGEGMDENVRSHIGSVITLDELGIDVEVMDITGEVDAVY